MPVNMPPRTTGRSPAPTTDRVAQQTRARVSRPVPPPPSPWERAAAAGARSTPSGLGPGAIAAILAPLVVLGFFALFAFAGWQGSPSGSTSGGTSGSTPGSTSGGSGGGNVVAPVEAPWVAGRRHPDFPHISSSSERNTWIADPGYHFPTKGDLRVVWTPGAAHPSAPHVLAASNEEAWTPVAGWRWTAPSIPNDLRVDWAAGRSHPTNTHIVSATDPDMWLCRPGYTWTADPNDGLAVVALATPRAPSHRGPTDEQVAAGLLKIAGAITAHAIAHPDNGETNALVTAFGDATRDALVRSAFGDLFPDLSDRALDAASNLLLLIVDGQLSVANWSTANLHNELVRRLQAADPSMADAYDVADFIANALERLDRR
jgi:hypothetical protein